MSRSVWCRPESAAAGPASPASTPGSAPISTGYTTTRSRQRRRSRGRADCSWGGAGWDVRTGGIGSAGRGTARTTTATHRGSYGN